MDIGLLGPLHVDHGRSPDARATGPRRSLCPGGGARCGPLAGRSWLTRCGVTSARVLVEGGAGVRLRLRKAVGRDAVETRRAGTGWRDRSAGSTPADSSASPARRGARRRRAARSRGHGVPAGPRLWRGRRSRTRRLAAGRSEAARLEELRRTAEEELLAARIAAGDREVTADAPGARRRGAAAGAPLGDARRWPSTAVAARPTRCARSGGRADAAGPARNRPGAELVELEAAILRQDPGLSDVRRRATAATCPYKGLAPYDADDAGALLRPRGGDPRAWPAWNGSPLLVVAGPSGCGKSSLVRAGLVPALRQRGRQWWCSARRRPGRDAWPAALAGPAAPGPGRRPVRGALHAPRRPGDRTRLAAPTSRLRRRAGAGRDRDPRRPPGRAGRRPVAGPARRTGLHLVTPLTGDAIARRDRGTGPARPGSGSNTASSTCWCATPKASRARCRCCRTRSPRPGNGATAACSP